VRYSLVGYTGDGVWGQGWGVALVESASILSSVHSIHTYLFNFGNGGEWISDGGRARCLRGRRTEGQRVLTGLSASNCVV
jgi:hypothetical protein